jgi:hypothetical protein
MKLAGLMILIPLVALFIVAAIGRQNRIGASPRQVRNTSASAPVLQRPDEAALQTLKREHASARFPYLVSSLCRHFLEHYPTSPHRAEVEAILKRNEEVLAQTESGVPAR